MSITASDVDFATILSLGRAVLVKRDRLNYLGSKELTLDYKLQTSGAKELCADWLATNRLSLIDPEFSFKVYEGTWLCVDISFNEDTKSIRQRFKIDSSLLDDVAQRDAGGDTLRSYYWKIVNPDGYNVPATSDAGDTWTKNVNDNGDGTYDVTITKRTDTVDALTSDSWIKTALYSEETELSLNSTEQTEPTAATGTTVRVQNTPLENGLFRAETTTRTAIMHRLPETEVAQTGGTWTNVSSMAWFTDGDVTKTSRLVIGRNRTWQEYINDYTTAPNFLRVSISVDVNDFGLYDYVIRCVNV